MELGFHRVVLADLELRLKCRLAWNSRPSPCLSFPSQVLGKIPDQARRHTPVPSVLFLLQNPVSNGVRRSDPLCSLVPVHRWGPLSSRGVHPFRSFPRGPRTPPPDTKEGAGSAECARARVSTQPVCQISSVFYDLGSRGSPPHPPELSFQEAFEIPTTLGVFVCLVVIFVL